VWVNAVNTHGCFRAWDVSLNPGDIIIKDILARHCSVDEPAALLLLLCVVIYAQVFGFTRNMLLLCLIMSSLFVAHIKCTCN
jgi:hypothetical protein